MGDRQNTDTTPEVDPHVDDLLPDSLPAISKLAETAHRQLLTGLRRLTPAQKRSPDVVMVVGQIAGAAYKIRSDMANIRAAVEHTYYPGLRSRSRTQRQEQAVSPARERVGREQEMLAVLALLGLIDEREGLSVEFVCQNAEPTPTVPSHLVIVRDLFELVGDDFGGEHEFRAETRLDAITLAYEFVRKLVSP